MNIDSAMGRVNLTVKDTVFLAKICADVTDEPYDSLPPGEQRSWNNAVLVMAFRKEQLSQDILERALGRKAYDAAVTKADKFMSTGDMLGAEFDGSGLDEVTDGIRAETLRRAPILGFTKETGTAEGLYPVYISVIAEAFSGDADLVRMLREKAGPEIWGKAMEYTERYAKATGDQA